MIALKEVPGNMCRKENLGKSSPHPHAPTAGRNSGRLLHRYQNRMLLHSSKP